MVDLEHWAVHKKGETWLTGMLFMIIKVKIKTLKLEANADFQVWQQHFVLNKVSDHLQE